MALSPDNSGGPVVDVEHPELAVVDEVPDPGSVPHLVNPHDRHVLPVSDPLPEVGIKVIHLINENRRLWLIVFEDFPYGFNGLRNFTIP